MIPKDEKKPHKDKHTQIKASTTTMIKSKENKTKKLEKKSSEKLALRDIWIMKKNFSLIHKEYVGKIRQNKINQTISRQKEDQWIIINENKNRKNKEINIHK